MTTWADGIRNDIDRLTEIRDRYLTAVQALTEAIDALQKVVLEDPMIAPRSRP